MIKATVKTIGNRHYVNINGKAFWAYKDYVDACLVMGAINQFWKVKDLYKDQVNVEENQ